MIGLIECLRKRDAFSISLILHWATLMVVHALPGVPPHDGIRLFLPAFGFWCVFAGIGAHVAWQATRQFSPVRRGLLVRTAIVVALIADAINLARYYPQTLSHYSLLVGGVRGAARLGMEPTYWWDALDDDVLMWLNEHTEPGAAVEKGNAAAWPHGRCRNPPEKSRETANSFSAAVARSRKISSRPEPGPYDRRRGLTLPKALAARPDAGA